jgi:hypothetical protein
MLLQLLCIQNLVGMLYTLMNMGSIVSAFSVRCGKWDIYCQWLTTGMMFSLSTFTEVKMPFTAQSVALPSISAHASETGPQKWSWQNPP